MEFLLQRFAMISRDVEAKEVEVDCTCVFEMFAVNTFIVEPLLFSFQPARHFGKDAFCQRMLKLREHLGRAPAGGVLGRAFL